MGVKAHLAFIKEIYKVELAAAMAYRFNFLTQSVGMFINDMFWVLFWFLFFQKFVDVNGWGFHEIVLLHAVFATGFGLAGVLFTHYRHIASYVEEGRLDYYLTMPKNVLLYTILGFGYSDFGDLVFGLTMALFAVSLWQWPLFLFLSLMSMIVFMSFTIALMSITFFVGRFEKAAKTGRNIMQTFAFYPFSAYKGTTRFVLLFIIPSGFVAGIPVELLTTFSWPWLFITIAVALGFSLLAIILFYTGLRKYESGNVMAMRG